MSTENDEIEVVNIQEQLTQLHVEGKIKGQIKGCLFNLIIYSQNQQRSLFLDSLVKTITETFPCRIIFIECDLQASHHFLKVSVSEEVIKKEGMNISCDKIKIQSTKEYLDRVPFLILPHFVPDLPIYLLWGQDPDPSQENEILPFLQTFATRLIFDSDTSCDLSEFCRKMLTDVYLKNIPIADMNWASLTSWREILYHIFDSKEKIEQLESCKQITIHYNSSTSEIHQYTSRRAIYLQGWLAAQLSWQYLKTTVDNHTMISTYQHRQGTVQVILEGKKIENLTSGAIVKVEIIAKDETLYDLSCTETQPFIKVHISKKDLCELPIIFPLRHSKKGLVFMNEIFFSPSSAHYWNMLKTLEHFQVSC